MIEQNKVWTSKRTFPLAKIFFSLLKNSLRIIEQSTKVQQHKNHSKWSQEIPRKQKQPPLYDSSAKLGYKLVK